MPATPVVPETITVHLGPPGSSARNVEVPFAAYIKNVASHEIYPTWPENAIRANILAQISYALNRVYTEYYRTRGYDYDITSTTQYDQAYVDGGDVFENISQIVDDSFNNYIVRQGSVEPLFAQFCDGVRTQCGGLSQWGSVDLARDGMNPYEILQYYYGGNISIVFNAPVGGNVPSYPGRPLRRGGRGQRRAASPAAIEPHPPELSGHSGDPGAVHGVRCAHGGGGEVLPADLQPDPGRHRGQGHLVQDQADL